jgi:crotonobetainyl-CoA:carnitine CoA-transferase CaiB-like acyl-CoA transferase
MNKPPSPPTLDPNTHCPLNGVRIMDLSRLVAGNTLTMPLADMGAEVIKVEPATGDTLRGWKVAGLSTAWKAYSRNKKSLAMNFRDPQAIDIMLKLASQAQVLIESFRPGTLEKMGMGPAVLLELNPKLVIVRISGWGQDGPYSHKPGFGTLIEGISGFASMNGHADREPLLPPIFLADMVAGLYGAVGVLTALREVEVNGGKGQVIDLPLLDPLFAILGAQSANYRLTGEVKPRTGNRSSNSAPRNAYKTRDGKWVALSASTQGMTERLLQSIGRAELITDPRFATNQARLQNVDELDGIIGAFIGSMDQQDCLAFFDKADVTVGPMYDIAEIERDPHFAARGIIREIPDAEMGSVPVHNVSPRLTGTPGGIRSPAPGLGEHNEELLHSLGLTDEQISRLQQSGLLVSAKKA